MSIESLGKKVLSLSKCYNLMIFFLNQHVPETDGQPFQKRLLALGKKIDELKGIKVEFQSSKGTSGDDLHI